MNGRVACLLSLVAGVLATDALAQVSAQDEKELALSLRFGAPCCVIDARPAAARKARPLAEALVYRPDLKIVPTASVVVIGDADAAATRIAETLSRKHPGKAFIAVKGGLDAWQAATRAALAASGETIGGMSSSYVIPSNTCEHGKPLQELRRDTK